MTRLELAALVSIALMALWVAYFIWDALNNSSYHLNLGG